MPKPAVSLRNTANTYTSPDERIIEISNGVRTDPGHKGALISLRNLPDGTFRVEVYRADPGILVVAAPSMSTVTE